MYVLSAVKKVLKGADLEKLTEYLVRKFKDDDQFLEAEWERSETQYRGSLTRLEAFCYRLASQIIFEDKGKIEGLLRNVYGKDLHKDVNEKTVAYLKVLVSGE
jgi:hypothetical protein